MNALDYWKECIDIAADECGLVMTDEQRLCLAESVEGGHDNYSMAFYQPPASDGFSRVEGEWKKKLDALQREFDQYRGGAEQAMRKALHTHSDACLSIRPDGSVYSHGGRTTQIL